MRKTAPQTASWGPDAVAPELDPDICQAGWARLAPRTSAQAVTQDGSILASLSSLGPQAPAPSESGGHSS